MQHSLKYIIVADKGRYKHRKKGGKRLTIFAHALCYKYSTVLIGGCKTIRVNLFGVLKAMDKVTFIVEVISLVLLTVTEIAVFVTNGLSGSGNAGSFGFINRTGAISDTYYTQVSASKSHFI